MAAKLQGLIWDLDCKQSVKMVLLKLADHADQYGGNAYPSVKRMARETGQSERSVQRILGELVKIGGLVIDGNAGGGYRYTRIYRLVFPRLREHYGTFEDLTDDQIEAAPGVSAAARRGDRVSPHQGDSHQRQAAGSTDATHDGAGVRGDNGDVRGDGGVTNDADRGATGDGEGCQAVSPKPLNKTSYKTLSARPVPRAAAPSVGSASQAPPTPGTAKAFWERHEAAIRDIVLHGEMAVDPHARFPKLIDREDVYRKHIEPLTADFLNDTVLMMATPNKNSLHIIDALHPFRRAIEKQIGRKITFVYREWAGAAAAKRREERAATATD